MKVVAAKIKNLECYDSPVENNYGDFIRFKISVDISKQLIKEIHVRFDGKQMWVLLKYESLPFYCYCCRMIGHFFKGCVKFDRNSEESR